MAVGTGHTQDTAGNSVDIVADTTAPELAHHPEQHLGLEDLH